MTEKLPFPNVHPNPSPPSPHFKTPSSFTYPLSVYQEIIIKKHELRFLTMAPSMYIQCKLYVNVHIYKSKNKKCFLGNTNTPVNIISQYKNYGKFPQLLSKRNGGIYHLKFLVWASPWAFMGFNYGLWFQCPGKPYSHR